MLDSLSLYHLIGNTNDPQAHTLQGLPHWFDMILVQQFLHYGEIDPFQLIYMRYQSMDCQNMRVRGICIVNLRLTFSFLIETKFSSFSIFFCNSHNKKWKYYITNKLSLTFTVFIEVRNLKAFNFTKRDSSTGVFL